MFDVLEGAADVYLFFLLLPFVVVFAPIWIPIVLVVQWGKRKDAAAARSPQPRPAQVSPFGSTPIGVWVGLFGLLIIVFGLVTFIIFSPN